MNPFWCKDLAALAATFVTRPVGHGAKSTDCHGHVYRQAEFRARVFAEYVPVLAPIICADRRPNQLRPIAREQFKKKKNEPPASALKLRDAEVPPNGKPRGEAPVPSKGVP